MFNIGGGEIAVILIVALLLLGPQKLPELARGIGKFMREFRRQTDEVRTMVEREFYSMDQELQREQAPPKAVPSSVQTPALDGTAEGGPAKPAGLGPGESAAAAAEAEAMGGAGRGAVPGDAGGAAPVGSADPFIAPSDSSQELFDARYHEMEANGLIPPESSPAPESSSVESSADAAHQAAKADAVVPAENKHAEQQQESGPRGK